MDGASPLHPPPSNTRGFPGPSARHSAAMATTHGKAAGPAFLNSHWILYFVGTQTFPIHTESLFTGNCHFLNCKEPPRGTGTAFRCSPTVCRYCWARSLYGAPEKPVSRGRAGRLEAEARCQLRGWTFLHVRPALRSSSPQPLQAEGQPSFAGPPGPQFCLPGPTRSILQNLPGSTCPAAAHRDWPPRPRRSPAASLACPPRAARPRAPRVPMAKKGLQLLLACPGPPQSAADRESSQGRVFLDPSLSFYQERTLRPKEMTNLLPGPRSSVLQGFLRSPQPAQTGLEV